MRFTHTEPSATQYPMFVLNDVLVPPTQPSRRRAVTQTFSDRTTQFILLSASLLLLLNARAEFSPQAAFSSALHATPAAGAVVDLKSGKLLAAVRSAASSPNAPSLHSQTAVPGRRPEAERNSAPDNGTLLTVVSVDDTATTRS